MRGLLDQAQRRWINRARRGKKKEAIRLHAASSKKGERKRTPYQRGSAFGVGGNEKKIFETLRRKEKVRSRDRCKKKIQEALRLKNLATNRASL